MTNVITGHVDYVSGHLRYGHFEMTLDDEEFEAFKALSKKEQINLLRNGGELIVDDWEVDDYGDICEVHY